MAFINSVLKAAYSSLPEINPATLSGAIDIVVVEQEDGTLKSSPFHLRFGRFKVLRHPKDRAIKITVNEQLVDFVMKLGETGVAYFVEETDEPPALEDMTSPVLSPRSDEDGSLASIPSINMQAAALNLSADGKSPPPHSLSLDPSAGASEERKRGAWSWGWGSLPKKHTPKAGSDAGDDGEEQGFLLDDLRLRLEQQAAEEEELARQLDAVDDDDVGVLEEEEKANEDSGHRCDKEEAAMTGGEAAEREEEVGAKEGAVLQGNDLPSFAETLAAGRGGGLEEHVDDGGILGILGGTGEAAGAAGEKAAAVAAAAAAAAECDREEEPESEREGQEGGGERGEGGGEKKRIKPSTSVRFLEQLEDAAVAVSEAAAAVAVQAEKVAEDQEELEELGELAELEEGGEEEEAEESEAARDRRRKQEMLRVASSGSLALMEEEAEVEAEPVTAALLIQLLQRSSPAAPPQMQISLCGRTLQQRGELSRKEQNQVFDDHLVTPEDFAANPLDVASSPELYVRVDGDIYRWQLMAPALISALVFGRDLPRELHAQLVALDSRFSLFHQDKRGLGGGDGEEKEADGSLDLLTRLAGDEDEEEPDDMGLGRTQKYQRKTLFPSQEQLASLPLREGENTIRFYLSHKASSDPITGRIFLWNHRSKVVISDVDGTITKSDVMGHIVPRLSFGWSQWAQKGVPQLLRRIQENNYNVLYLTARPIGQVETTKHYLKSVVESGVHLPVGPVITSPDGLFKSLNREVIRKKPQEFKIECLQGLKNLFPPDVQPFYAGFGNRETDTVSYREVDVPESRIFIINPEGEIHNALNKSMVSSYDGLRELCDLMFPPIDEEKEAADEQFNAFNFWKVDPYAQAQQPPREEP